MGLLAFLFSIAVLVENAVSIQLYFYREPTYFASLASLAQTMVSFRQQTHWVSLLKVLHELKADLAKRLVARAKSQSTAKLSRTALRSAMWVSGVLGAGGGARVGLWSLVELDCSLRLHLALLVSTPILPPPQTNKQSPRTPTAHLLYTNSMLADGLSRGRPGSTGGAAGDAEPRSGAATPPLARVSGSTMGTVETEGAHEDLGTTTSTMAGFDLGGSAAAGGAERVLRSSMDHLALPVTAPGAGYVSPTANLRWRLNSSAGGGDATGDASSKAAKGKEGLLEPEMLQKLLQSQGPEGLQAKLEDLMTDPDPRWVGDGGWECLFLVMITFALQSRSRGERFSHHHASIPTVADHVAPLQQPTTDNTNRLDNLQRKIHRAALTFGGMHILSNRLYSTLVGGAALNDEQATLAEFKAKLGEAYNMRWRLLSAAIDQCCRYVFVVGYVVSVLATALTLVTQHKPLYEAAPPN